MFKYNTEHKDAPVLRQLPSPYELYDEYKKSDLDRAVDMFLEELSKSVPDPIKF